MAVQTGKHILFEGPVGVGKTVLAVALAKHFERGFHRVDGDERYTEHKLVGWFDPPLVIEKSYTYESFIPGPLKLAMDGGSFLFINELNRLPEGTQNVLLPAMDEGQIVIPKLGVINANPGFLIIATQNPEEYVGTSRISEALKDRFVWIGLKYQTEEEEAEIVKKETGCKNDFVVRNAVNIARKTREEANIRRGASVRGVIDLTSLVIEWSNETVEDEEIWVRASTMALVNRIEPHDRSDETIEEIIRKIVLSVLEDSLKKKTYV